IYDQSADEDVRKTGIRGRPISTPIGAFEHGADQHPGMTSAGVDDRGITWIDREREKRASLVRSIGGPLVEARIRPRQRKYRDQDRERTKRDSEPSAKITQVCWKKHCSSAHDVLRAPGITGEVLRTESQDGNLL